MEIVPVSSPMCFSFFLLCSVYNLILEYETHQIHGKNREMHKPMMTL